MGWKLDGNFCLGLCGANIFQPASQRKANNHALFIQNNIKCLWGVYNVYTGISRLICTLKWRKVIFEVIARSALVFQFPSRGYAHFTTKLPNCGGKKVNCELHVQIFKRTTAKTDQWRCLRLRVMRLVLRFVDSYRNCSSLILILSAYISSYTLACEINFISFIYMNSKLKTEKG